MSWTSEVDGFRLCYDRVGTGVAAVLLHGWPGDRSEYCGVVARLPTMDVVVPDLRGFGASDWRSNDPTSYGADAQARSVVGLIEELGLDRPVVAGHDIGSRIAVAIARLRPDLIRALVLTPPLPGMGERILGPQAAPEFWYLSFNQLPFAVELLDGRPDAMRVFLRHFWTHWAGPGFAPPDGHLDHLVSVYSQPGRAAALLGWYRAGVGALARVVAERPPPPAERIAVPTTVLWPDRDPLFPPAWSDRLDQHFADLQLQHLGEIGHFVPMEAPDDFAEAVAAAGAIERSPFGSGTGQRLASNAQDLWIGARVAREGRTFPSDRLKVTE
ncbi:alpha/beta fold hydrolase [Streptomyces xantholiticus]|uniref:Alpha/beta hydrolase n=1 Tax=Streptomyces xantholiticus TaxID=68285 RepID=A0ABV1V4R7_9ACTN